MIDHNDEHLNHAPLRGVVLCCTSIPPEERHAMAQIAEQMGATHKLDLTSDITHLIVGNIDTPKYKYTAKERPDIKVLHPSWLEAVRASWLEGGETDVDALEIEHRLPALFGLQICVTGFDNLDQRSDIQHKVASNGAQYHGDLTRTVTHLIAAHPTGKKYDFACQWRMKIVSIEWLQDSLERGLALDESLYHPLMPVEQRGVGAINKRMGSPSLGKRARQETQGSGQTEGGRRKLRRTASTRLESQNDDMWADIGKEETKEDTSFELAPMEQSIDKSEGSSVTLDDRAMETRKENIHLQSNKETLPANTSRPTSAGQRTIGDHPEFERKSNLIFNSSGRVDSGEVVYIYGFDERKERILYNFLVAHGAVVLSEQDMTCRAEMQHSNLTIIVPHDMERSLVEDLQSQSYYNESDHIVNDFWVEKCLHHKSVVDRTAVQYQPFSTIPIIGFEKLTICPTSFAGIELLHFSKIVKLMGATYDEFLKKDTSVLVCNDTSLNQDKLKYAIEHFIPIVSPHWLWTSISTGEVQPFKDFALSGSRQIQNSTQPCFYHPSHNPRPRMKRNEQHKLVRSASGRPVRQQLEFCSEPVPLKPAHLSPHQQVKKPPEQSWEDPDNDFAPRRQQPSSQPFRELPQETNSPRKSSQRSQTRQASPHLADIENHVTAAEQEEPAPPTPPPPPEEEQKPSTPPPQRKKSPSKSPVKNKNPSPSQATTTLQTAIAHLLYHQQKAAASVSTTAAQDLQAPRRHRPLGRASSNPSSLGTSALSRQNSAAINTQLQHGDDCDDGEDTETSYDDDHDDDGGSMRQRRRRKTLHNQARSFHPSQALGYEDPDAVAVRESLMKGVSKARKVGKAKRGKEEEEEEEEEGNGEEGGMRKVQRIGRVVDEGVLFGGGGAGEGARRRRGGRTRRGAAGGGGGGN